MLRRVAFVITEVSAERRLLKQPHGVTSQGTEFFIVTSVKPPNLIHNIIDCVEYSVAYAEDMQFLAINPVPLPLPRLYYQILQI
jgi:hypothetical protein